MQAANCCQNSAFSRLVERFERAAISRKATISETQALDQMLAHTRQVAAGNDVEDFCFKETSIKEALWCDLADGGPTAPTNWWNRQGAIALLSKARSRYYEFQIFFRKNV